MGVLKDSEEAARRRMAEVQKIRDGLRGETPGERRWVARFLRCIAEMPETLYVVAGDQEGATVYLDAAEEGHEIAHTHHRRIFSSAR